MAEKYYAVWVYSLPSTKYIKGYRSPIFTSKYDAIAYAQLYLNANKRRGAEIIRCSKNNPMCAIALNGNEPTLHYRYSSESKKVIKDTYFDKIFN